MLYYIVSLKTRLHSLSCLISKQISQYTVCFHCLFHRITRSYLETQLHSCAPQLLLWARCTFAPYLLVWLNLQDLLPPHWSKGSRVDFHMQMRVVEADGSGGGGTAVTAISPAAQVCANASVCVCPAVPSSPPSTTTRCGSNDWMVPSQSCTSPSCRKANTLSNTHKEKERKDRKQEQKTLKHTHTHTHISAVFPLVSFSM